jgi:nucleotide-binding universal stress UspA family protein
MTRLKVLIPLDGSKLAEASLAYLSSLRALGEVEPRLFSVVEEHEPVPSLDIEEAIKREHKLLSAYLRETGADIEKHLGLVCDTRLAYGKPAIRIIEAIDDFHADLVVISTHGRTGATRWRLGSVADKVIRSARCNLMVIGPKAARSAEWLAESTKAFKAILLPLDGSDLAEEAIPTALRFADRYDSVLHMVRVVTIPIYGDISGDVGYPDLMQVMEDSANHYLNAVSERPAMPTGVCRKVLMGSPASQLETYIADQRIDLVVMTSHGRGGLSRAAYGSITDRLLGGTAPILVVKPVGIPAVHHEN